MMRLNKFLAKSGIASRRKCDILIKEGKIKVNGKIVSDLSTQIVDKDFVQFNNKLVELNFNPIIYLFNKPKGVISTVTDPYKRKTILDFFDTKERLFPIGRLDRDTTGVLLVTNDGDLAHRMMHPKFQVERKYFIETKISINQTKLKLVQEGVRLDNGQQVKAKINFIDKKFNRNIYEAILFEGKNREVKNIFKFLDSKVESLHRFSFAGIELGKLKVGRKKKIPLNVIKGILKT